eukprot:11176463-Lingulodinium_polyedra.AAC.1
MATGAVHTTTHTRLSTRLSTPAPRTELPAYQRKTANKSASLQNCHLNTQGALRICRRRIAATDEDALGITTNGWATA